MFTFNHTSVIQKEKFSQYPVSFFSGTAHRTEMTVFQSFWPMDNLVDKEPAVKLTATYDNQTNVGRKPQYKETTDYGRDLLRI